MRALLPCLLGPLFFLLLIAPAHLQQPPRHYPHNDLLPGIQLPTQFQSMEDHCQQHMMASHRPEDAGLQSTAPACPGSHPVEHSAGEDRPSTMRLSMKHRDSHPLHQQTSPSESLRYALWRDSYRVYGMGMKATYPSSPPASISMPILSAAPSPAFVGDKDTPPPYQPPHDQASTPISAPPQGLPRTLQSYVESGATLGCGEYFMDVYIGMPPRHFSLIIDTGSDLIWTQCSPCKACYSQEGPVFSPNASSSYKRIPCSDDRHCKLVSTVYDKEPCLKEKPHSCKYSYWYGDMSNTTGELAMETFTLNLGNGQPFNLEDVVFGCGHSNQGLFRGAGGLLGLGKGPLSFPSQLRHRFGHKFSYCLVNRNSNTSVSSILIFGEDKRLLAHPDLQYTGFIRNTPVQTFYYLDVEKVSVGGEEIAIPPSAWALDAQGQGGTIIDSGTTLTYFTTQAYKPIAKAFEDKISYPRASSMLDMCYNVSGVSDVQFPEFSIFFKDGAVFKPPVENYFIEVESDPLTFCLAILEAPSANLSILGNFLQQNIHVLYDLESFKLGFAPMVCSAL